MSSEENLPIYASSAYAGHMPNEKSLKKYFARAINYIRSELSASTIIEQIPLSNNANILEIGVGVGDLANALKEKRKDLIVHGFDLSFKALKLNQKRNYSAIVADLLHTPYPDNQFDLVFSTDVYEHVPEADQSVAELFRITKPGGYIMHAIADPSEARYWKVRGHLKREDNDISHVKFWETQITNAGFRLLPEKNIHLRKKDWRRIISQSNNSQIKKLKELPGFATVLNKFHRPGIYIAQKPL